MLPGGTRGIRISKARPKAAAEAECFRATGSKYASPFTAAQVTAEVEQIVITAEAPIHHAVRGMAHHLQQR
jgi:hypothetical protein